MGACRGPGSPVVTLASRPGSALAASTFRDGEEEGWGYAEPTTTAQGRALRPVVEAIRSQLREFFSPSTEFGSK